MTIPKAIVVVVTCALIVTAIGALMGGAIGAFVPGYYRSVFRGGHEPEFDPVAVGVGQGATQGIAGGVLVGVILIGIIAWRERRTAATGSTLGDQSDTAVRTTRPWGWILITAGIGLLFAFGTFSVGMLVGALIGEQGAYDRRYEEEKALIEEALASDPLIDRIVIEPRSSGGVKVSGSVRTQTEHERLHDFFAQALGEPRATELVVGVDVLE